MSTLATSVTQPPMVMVPVAGQLVIQPAVTMLVARPTSLRYGVQQSLIVLSVTQPQQAPPVATLFILPMVQLALTVTSSSEGLGISPQASSSSGAHTMVGGSF